MDSATKSRLFEPFFTTKAPGHGTGLGLAVVLAVMEAANGEIHVETTPGAGSTFELRFPQAR
jgi:signal transduction histidine kinase